MSDTDEALAFADEILAEQGGALDLNDTETRVICNLIAQAWLEGQQVQLRKRLERLERM